MPPSNWTIVHVATLPRVLLQFRLPILREQRRRFGRLIVYCPPFPEIRALEEEGFEVVPAPVTNRVGPWTPFEAGRLARFLRSVDAEIVVGHQPIGGLVAVGAGLLAGTPARLYSTGGLKHQPDGTGLRNRLLRAGELALIRRSTAALLVNREDEEALGRIPGLEGKGLWVGPSGGCGLDTARFNPTRRALLRDAARSGLDIANSCLTIGFVGRLVLEKGFDQLFEAFRRLAGSSVLPPLRLVLFGDGPDEGRIREKAAARGIADRTLFAGYRSPVEEAYAALDLFVLPSRREGLPIALLQAMAMGIPSVASRIRGNRELIVDGENGRLAEVGSSDSLFEAIRELASNPEVAARLGETAARSVRERYSEAALLPRTLALIEEVAAAALDRAP
jgi:glycosyltransferase involved in cell wall biosynthesis